MYAIRDNQNTEALRVRSRTIPVHSDSSPVGFFIGANMKKIPLTQRQYALVDDKDFEWLSRWGWYAHKTSGGGFRAGRSISVKGKRRMLYLHRVIMNAPAGFDVDHINHNQLDNRRCNLRVATHAQNLWNSKKRKGCSSKYKGVYWAKRDNRWSAAIESEGKRYFLGNYKDEIDAAKAYDKAATKYFGEHANLNFERKE